LKVIKYEHSCLVIEEKGQKLVIDPGVFSESFTDFSNISGVVVTHMHPDHFDPSKLSSIIEQNPAAMIFTVSDVAEHMEQGLPRTIVSNGNQISCGPFSVEFFGGRHATIHNSVPPPENIGVLINKKIYYPGDSFTVPHQPVVVLAVPASAPWAKTAEAMDFITALKPKTVFPTHDALLSDIGRQITDPWLQRACEAVSASYLRLKTGEVIEA
jgi:L-ascorbate metabolism protein UlaG (beta-lactamase superfamily)